MSSQSTYNTSIKYLSNQNRQGTDCKHERHYNGALKLLRETVIGVPEVRTKHDNVCKGCVLGKFTKASFPRSDILVPFVFTVYTLSILIREILDTLFICTL